jgi:hypothetical protein
MLPPSDLVLSIITSSGGGSVEDFTSVTGTVEQGVSYSYSISSSWGYDYTSIWVDFDDNGFFDYSEALVYQQFGYNPTTGTFNHSWLSKSWYTHHACVHTYAGWSTDDASDPCANDYYGQAEDYTITVIPQTPKQVNSFTVDRYSTNDVVAGSE